MSSHQELASSMRESAMKLSSETETRSAGRGGFRFSLKWLLGAFAVLCITLAAARVWFKPTPRDIMQRARVGVALLNSGADGAVITIGHPTILNTTLIDAIAEFEREYPIHGIIIKGRRMKGVAVELVERLEHLKLVYVNRGSFVDGGLLTAMPAKQNLQRLALYNCDLTGLEFPQNLRVSILQLDDSILASEQVATLATYHDLSHVSACGVSTAASFDCLLGLNKLQHVSLVDTDVTNTLLEQLLDLPSIEWIDVTDSADTRGLLERRGDKVLLHPSGWRPVSAEL